LLLSLTGRATPRLEDRIGALSRWSFPHQINRGKSINSTSDIDKTDPYPVRRFIMIPCLFVE